VYTVLYRRPECSLRSYTCESPNKLLTLLADFNREIIKDRLAYGCPHQQLEIVESVKDFTGTGKDNTSWPVWTALILCGDIVVPTPVQSVTTYTLD